METEEYVLESVSGFRLSPVQAALWRAGKPAFSRARLRIESAITPDWLAEAIEEIAAAHDGMRAAFRTLAGMDAPLQVIGDRLDPVVAHETLSALADEAAVERIAELWEAVPDPDWRSGGLLWATLLDLPGDRQLIQIVAPAILADADSLGAILRTIAARIAGEPIPEPSGVHYLHYSEWCHDNADSDAALEAREHWRRVEEARCPLRLPFERDARAGGHDMIERRCAPVAEHELLGAWAAVLGRYGDSRALTIHRRFHERPFAELVDGVGPSHGGCGLSATPGTSPSRPFWVPTYLYARRFSWRPAEPGIGIECEDALDDFALALHAQEGADEVMLQLRFDRARYESAQIERIADALVESVAARAPDIPVGGFVRIGVAERLLLDDWSHDGEGPLSADTIHGRFAEVARGQPDAPAVRTAEETLSFRELDRRADAVAARLAAIGVAGGRVALIAERGAATIAAMLGVLKAGAAFVPIDPGNPPHRIAQLVAAADVAAVLGTLPPGVAPESPVLPLDVADGEAPGTAATLRLVEADAPAYVIFTSGSTGVPKGVVVTHRSAVNLAEALQDRIYRENRALTVSVNAPFSFDAAIKQFVQLLNGHCLAPIPEAARRDAGALLGLIRDLQIDVLDCTPSHLKLLFAAGFADWRGVCPSIILVGGEPIDAATWPMLAGHPAAFWNLYGPTEATVNATAAQIDAGCAPNIGRPLRNVRVRLVDDALAPVPIGVPGEILIGGAGVALGYLDDAEQTAARFLSDPFAQVAGEGRVYRSGDRGVYDAVGNLRFLDRIDDQVKIRGYRLEPGEIAAVVRDHPGVADVHVGAIDGGEGGKQLVAWYVPRNRTGALHDALLPTLRQINASETDYLYQEIFVDHAYGVCDIRLPDDAVVFDVGANIGMFSIYVAQRCARPTIHAFEPIPTIHAALEANLALHVPHAVRHAVGLSSEAHSERFTYYPGYSTMSGEARYADAAGEVDVIKTYLRNQQAADLGAESQEAATLLA
ncbi:MAG: amino acid adenylation domain-containing protein, partial [Novosphingobium sp.]